MVHGDAPVSGRSPLLVRSSGPESRDLIVPQRKRSPWRSIRANPTAVGLVVIGSHGTARPYGNASIHLPSLMPGLRTTVASRAWRTLLASKAASAPCRTARVHIRHRPEMCSGRYGGREHSLRANAPVSVLDERKSCVLLPGARRFPLRALSGRKDEKRSTAPSWVLMKSSREDRLPSSTERSPIDLVDSLASCSHTPVAPLHNVPRPVVIPARSAHS